MDWKIELIAIPVTDVDRAKAFYVDQVGFHADHDHKVHESLRFVQLAPPGSACSIVLGTGVTDMAPGSQKGVQVVVADVVAARTHLLDHGVEASEIDEQPWGFAPYHYGRWAHAGNRWVWVPPQRDVRPVYAPALVAFVVATVVWPRSRRADPEPHRGGGRKPMASALADGASTQN